MAKEKVDKKAPKKAEPAAKAEKKKSSSPKKESRSLSGPILYPKDLITGVAVQNGLSKVIVEKTLTSLLKAIEANLEQGGEVRINGFGTFSVKQMKPRKVFHVRKKIMIDLPALRRPFFKPSVTMRDRMR